MERAKRSRKPYRTALTRTIHEVEQELLKEEKDLDILRDKLEKLVNLEIKLLEADSKILDAMLDDNVEEDVFEAEHLSQEKYQDDVRLCKTAINKVLLRVPVEIEIPEACPSSVSNKTRSYKLPKLEIRKFSGDLKDWLGWWSQFSKIDEDEELFATDKFQYLVQATVEGTRVRRLVEGYPQTAANYPKVIEALKDRFGDKTILTEYYVRQLARLVIDNAMKSKKTNCLGTMYDELESSLRALESLGVTADQSAAFLYPLVESSLPDDLIKVWQRSPLSGYDDEEDQPVDQRLQSLMKFLKKEVKGEERLSFVQAGIETPHSSSKEKRRQPRENYHSLEDVPTAAGLFSSTRSTCIFCDKNHDSKDCGKVMQMPLQERKSKVEASKCCFICFKSGHMSKKCRAFVKCPFCDKRHSIILCPDLSSIKNSRTKNPNQSVEMRTSSSENPSSLIAMACTGSVFLQTLRIKLHGPNGTKVVRGLIDSGSQQSYILNSTALELGMNSTSQQPLVHNLFGGLSTEVNIHNRYEVKVESTVRNNSMSLKFLGHEKICNTLPLISRGSWLKNLRLKKIWLSDYGPGPQEIEVLFGADSAAHLFIGNVIVLQPGIIAMETKLGWTLMGENSETTQDSLSTLVVHSYLSTTEIDQLWKIDVLGINDPQEFKNQEELNQEAKTKLIKTMSRTPNGAYVIRLPWIDSKQSIPSNKEVAFKRLQSATAKLQKSNKMSDYANIFLSWIKEGLIVVDSSDGSGHYLPHRPVFKPQSLTTPIRPVFDASCKVGRNPSLNQCLEKGPNLLEVIPSILLRFRRKRIGCVADIRKAYQMIRVCDEDQQFLRFLWWTDDGKLLTYRHCRVVFGVNCSAFILAAVLEHHLSQVPKEERFIADELLKSLYVDNAVTSVDSYDEYEQFKNVSVQILARANMELRQWEHSSVGDSRIGSLSNNGCGLGSDRKRLPSTSCSEGTTSVLGLRWNKTTDSLSCDVPSSLAADTEVTKREILSTAAKVFDPLGFTCPALLMPKLLLQELWIQKKGWDEELPLNIQSKFKHWKANLNILSSLEIPRYAFDGEPKSVSMQLHTFTDASKHAYAAAVFIRIDHGSNVEVHLLLAKARVAPIKNLTIPRLELMGCLIGTRLCQAVVNALNLQHIPHYFWTDSSVALAWIQRNNEWGTFIGNRVKEIHTSSNQESWRHVPGNKNPADLPSRGCDPVQLAQSRWWEGPSWLKLNIEDWPTDFTKPDEQIIQTEMKKSTTALFSGTRAIPWYINRYSCFHKNLRLLSTVRRFIAKCKKTKFRSNIINMNELRETEMLVFKLVQNECFSPDVELIEGIRVQKSEDGMYRVITKLLNKEDTQSFKLPILLPSNHPLVEQLIWYEHISNGHTGVQWLMSNLRERVWIIKSRKTIKAVISKCVVCKRYSTKAPAVPIAPLPLDRVKDTSPFEVTGVDLAGPLYLKDHRKAWIVIFTCAVFRAVHLEMVNSLSTDDFLLALQKFICRRGRPVTIYSDNGTNFHGTDNLFKTLDWEKIQAYSNVKRIAWRFNPPSAAWWGGWWERLIRYMKDLMRRMLGHRKLTHNQLDSVLCEVESIMNSRPLTYVSDDQEDLIPLTPQMFLHGLQHSSFPEAQEINGTTLQNCNKNLRQLRAELNKRFRREYLSQLVHRGKSKKIIKFNIGDIVLVGSDVKKRIFWPMGRVTELMCGQDGKTRVAKVVVKGGELIRPLQRLFPLEISSPSESLPVSTPVMERAKLTTKDVEDPEVTVTRYGRRVKKPNYY